MSSHVPYIYIEHLRLKSICVEFIQNNRPMNVEMWSVVTSPYHFIIVSGIPLVMVTPFGYGADSKLLPTGIIIPFSHTNNLQQTTWKTHG